MSDKKKLERYYTTQPKYVTRVVARQPKKEFIGWGFEVRDGHGELVAWSTVIYKSAEIAYEQARERFGEQTDLRDFFENIARQAINEKWAPWVLAMVLDKVLADEVVGLA